MNCDWQAHAAVAADMFASDYHTALSLRSWSLQLLMSQPGPAAANVWAYLNGMHDSLAGGLAWLGFLAFGVISEQIKTRLEEKSEREGTQV